MTQMPFGPLHLWAEEHGVDPLYLRAVVEVESNGRALDERGEPLSRFEPHHFPSPERIGFTGGWRDSLALTNARRRLMFEQALDLDEEAACAASSWGAPQIMGFNHERCGYTTARGLRDGFREPHAQAEALATYLGSDPRLVKALKAKDSREFARIYNGPANVDVYAPRINSAYERLAGGAAPRVLRRGDKGAAVRELQVALTRAGYRLQVDGAFGVETERKVRQFQYGHDLAVDGLVGAKTWVALENAGGTESIPAAKNKTDLDLDALGKAGAAIGAAAAAAGPVIEQAAGLPEVVQYIIWGAAGLCAVIAVGAFAWRMVRGRS